MGKPASAHKKPLAEKDTDSVREDYVKRMRNNYPLIVRSLMHDIIVSVDKDGDFVFLNDSAVEFFGKSSEKLIGANFTEYLHPEDLEKGLRALQDIMNGKEMTKDFTVRVKSSRGFRTLAMNGIAVFDDEGNFIGAHATGKDLTDLLQTEEELKWSRRHFQRLFEVIVDPIIIVDLTGNILELSQAAEEILGAPKGKAVGKHILETKVTSTKNHKVLKTNLKKLTKGMYIQPQLVETVTKDGEPVLYEVSPARIMYRGQPAVLAIFRNITEQKKTEEKLQESEERFKNLLDNAPEAIWIQEVTGVFIDGNKKAEELTGYTREELVGKNLLDLLVPPENIPRIMEDFRATMFGELTGPVELEMVKKDGSLVSVEATTIPVERDGKIEIIGITRDITERKKAEMALRDSEARFRELSELLPEVVFETDIAGRITFANQIAFDRFGYTQKDFDKGLDTFQMLIPKERDRAKKEIYEILNGADIGFTEYTGLRKDGSTFPV
ncbi:MAG: PAS domain S-box protein, partial [Candidatus Bathyarchaeota archaeon]